tara:strand:+ start:479 stop:1009 length:531 start_codon:yes stop_codon:yes gene_type:complete
MAISNKLYKTLAYTILTILFVLFIFHCFNLQKDVFNQIKNFDYEKHINVNAKKLAALNSSNIEGFGTGILKQNKGDPFKNNENENVFKVIENKLRGLTEEIGGESGKKEVKQILVNTKKICNLECAKCMMTMIDDNKSGKTIDLDKMIEDEDDENCIKCRKYTDLSDSIKSMIDNL